MTIYTAPTRDMQFLLHDVLQVSAADLPGHADLDREFTEAILEAAGQLASDMLVPLNAVGDQQGCVLENGVVRTPVANGSFLAGITRARVIALLRGDLGTSLLTGAPVVDELLARVDDWGSGATPESPVVLVAHGGVIAAMTAALLDLPVANWPVFGGLANTSWVQLSGHGLPGEKPRWRLDVWNASAEVADAGVQ